MSSSREADFSGILGEMFALIANNWRVMLAFAAVIGGLSATGGLMGWAQENDALAGIDFGFRIDQTDTLASGLFSILSSVASVIASYFLAQACLAERGRLAPGGSRIWAYLGLVILSRIGMVLGLVLLLVPGIILFIRWSAATGFLIADRAGVTDSMTKSWDATRGHSWPIFFAGLVLMVAFVIATGIVGAVTQAIGSEALSAVAAVVIKVLGQIGSLAFAITIYLLVSDSTAEIESVFA